MLFISSVKIPRMCYVIVNFLLEVDNMLSWIADEVTAAVEKVGAKGSMFSDGVIIQNRSNNS